MKILKWLNKYFNGLPVYHCKPLLRDHEWRVPNDDENFPICIHCGKRCWWMRGYTLNSGTELERDDMALSLMDPDDDRLSSIPWDSQPVK